MAIVSKKNVLRIVAFEMTTEEPARYISQSVVQIVKTRFPFIYRLKRFTRFFLFCHMND